MPVAKYTDGIPDSLSVLTVAATTGVPKWPTIAKTLSSSMNFVRAALPLAGSNSSSVCRNLICRPSMPPDLLTMSR